eukprot:TRINITY_DN6835_c0_g4_i1.p1 TRINITY_DN6835_c0_g4~~TRINITY_DN6835_c0_g4_i1.p1  ORF type:complete len:113 (+),score=25.68 TRINITY_DN6835_c0_g4_i1:151-489(+)
MKLCSYHHPDLLDAIQHWGEGSGNRSSPPHRTAVAVARQRLEQRRSDLVRTERKLERREQALLDVQGQLGQLQAELELESSISGGQAAAGPGLWTARSGSCDSSKPCLANLT